jgi:hypothetical protein
MVILKNDHQPTSQHLYIIEIDYYYYYYYYYSTYNFCNVTYLSDTELKRAIRRLRSTKFVEPHEIPNFITKGSSEKCTPLLRHIFDLSILTGRFPSLWKQEAVVPIFKKGSIALVTK